MDNKTKAKYLGMLVQTVIRVDDSQFSQRVNAEKHDYADWIVKNMKDEELAKQIRPITTKQGVVDFLKQTIDELNKETPDAAESKRDSNSENDVEKSVPAKPAMDGATKAKYLNMLLQTVIRIDPNTFKSRVSDGKHDYADWIMKNIKDEELSVELRRITDKQTLLEFISYKIGEWSPELAKTIKLPEREKTEIKQIPVGEDEIIPPAPTIKPRPEEKEVEQPKAQTHPALQDVHENYHFVLPSGERIASLPQLAELLPDMDTEHFSAHVTEYKNDFAAWIHHAVKDEELAQRIGPVKDKQEMTDIILSRIKQHEATPVVMDAPKAQPIAQPVPLTSAPQQVRPNIPPPLPTPKAPVTAKPESIIKPEAQKIPKIEPKPITIPKPPEKPIIIPELQVAKLFTQPPKPSREIDLWSMSPIEILKKLGLIKDSTQFLALEEEFKHENKKRKCIKTGVPGFDDMIGDGIPLNSTILMSGGPGSGKTTFCIQMLGWAAEQGEKCLFMTFEETEENLIEHMEAYGLKPREYIANGTLMIQRQDPFKISRMVEALLAHARGELLINIDEIIDLMPKGFKPDRIVIDSLSAIASAFSESNTAYRVYVTKLIDMLQKTGATSFLITEVQGIEQIGHGLVEEFLADGVVVFYNLQKGNIKQSALEILKMRAVNHEKKIVPFEFVEGKGLVVYPLERTFI